MPRLEIEKTGEFGAHFNRPLTGEELEGLFTNPRNDHLRAIDDGQFVRGEAPSEVLNKCEPIKGGNNLLRLTLFMHRDALTRVLTRPLKPRAERTWFLHRDDYYLAQANGVRWALDSGRLNEPSAKDCLQRHLRSLERGVRSDFPFSHMVVLDHGVNESFVRGYQSAVLETPGVRTEPIDWGYDPENAVEGNWPFVVMGYRTPHFREVNSDVCFSDIIHTVRRRDIRVPGSDI